MSNEENVFFTDRQLRNRWHCSHMKLWRLRQDGHLPPPLKLGGTGINLTLYSMILRLEAAEA